MRALAVLMIGAVLAACAQMGVPQPQSCQQRLAYAYGVNTAVREASVAELKAGAITTEDMEHIIALNDQARALLDAARTLPDPAQAESRLALATAVLTELQAFLRRA